MYGSEDTICCVCAVVPPEDGHVKAPKHVEDSNVTYMFILKCALKLVEEIILKCTLFNVWGHDSSVGIATRYGLDGSRIESRWRRDFRHTSRPALGPTQPPIKWASGNFPGGNAAGAWR